MTHDFPIKNKKLHRSATAILDKLKSKMSHWQRGDLQYEIQDEETKRELYKAIDHLQAFCDNIS